MELTVPGVICLVFILLEKNLKTDEHPGNVAEAMSPPRLNFLKSLKKLQTGT